MKKLIVVLAFVPVAALFAASTEWFDPAVRPPVCLDYDTLTNIANKVEVLWTAHTNRIKRIERAQKMREARNMNGRPPVKPFKVKEGAKR